MKIGITFDLRQDYLKMGFSEEETAEFDKEETVTALQETLHELGFETERIGHIKNLVNALASGKRWDMVFNISEGMYGIGREAQVPALLDAYGIPYTFSDPVVLSLSLHKELTKRVVRDLKVATADFAVVYYEADIENIKLPFPLFAKPVAEGTSKGIDSSSRVNNMVELRQVCKKLLEKFKQPVLVEEFLPGREFTVGIIGTGAKAKVIGAIEVLLRNDTKEGIYSYNNKENYEELVEYKKVESRIFKLCEDNALKIWKGLGCRDAGRIDFRMDAGGVLNFMEVNPLAGLNPVRSDLPIMCRFHEISFRSLIEMIMNSALERINKI